MGGGGTVLHSVCFGKDRDSVKAGSDSVDYGLRFGLNFGPRAVKMKCLRPYTAWEARKYLGGEVRMSYCHHFQLAIN